jgi:hypothetical protein
LLAISIWKTAVTFRDDPQLRMGASSKVMAVGHLSTVLRDRDGHRWVAEVAHGR